MVSRQRSTMTIPCSPCRPCWGLVANWKDTPDTVTCSNSKPVGMPDVQKLRAVLRTTRAPRFPPMQGHVGLFDPDRRLNFVLADFETDASARFRKESMAA